MTDKPDPFAGLLGRMNPETSGDLALPESEPSKNFVPKGFVPEDEVEVNLSVRVAKKWRTKVRADAQRRGMSIQKYVEQLIERGY